MFVTNMYPTAQKPAFGIFVRRMQEGLEELGHSVTTCPISGDRGEADYLVGRRRIKQVATRVRPDIVHVHYGYSILATSRGWPRVTTFYGDDLNGESLGNGRFTLKSRIGKAVSWYAAAVSERTIAVSDRLRDQIPCARARARCTVIRDAVDTRVFYPRDRGLARQTLGIASDERLVIFPHNAAVATKRIDLARAAVRLLSNGDVGPVRLWVVNGKPPSDMPTYYAAADAMLVTSDTEGGPSSAKEALACGIPVVSVDVGDTETLNRVPAGGYVVSRNPTAIAEGLLRALNSIAAVRVSLLPAELTHSAAARAVVEVYERALKSHRRPR